MRIGYFGGSFDPPHRGHLAVACAARDHFGLDLVLLAPTGRQPLKPGGSEASFADRLHMTELLCEAQPRLQASAIDAPRPGGEPNYTVDTLRRLRAALEAQHPGQPLELFSILGADAFQHLPQWRDPQALFRLTQWIVVSRPGSPLPTPEDLPLAPSNRAAIHLLPTLHDPTSATDLRTQFAAGQDTSHLLPKSIEQYIRTHHLYRPKSHSPA